MRGRDRGPTTSVAIETPAHPTTWTYAQRVDPHLHAGNIVKHLGVQMYAGRPVPAIAELISNAWDADATNVNVRLPLDVPWDSSDADHFIEVEDNGNGMTWEMVRDDYLDVGRDRREVERTDRSPGGRLVQGRKGVGKLARIMHDGGKIWRRLWQEGGDSRSKLLSRQIASWISRPPHRHEQRYAPSLRPSSGRTQEAHSRFRRRQPVLRRGSGCCCARLSGVLGSASGLPAAFATCGDASRVEHSLVELIKTRVFAIVAATRTATTSIG